MSVKLLIDDNLSWRLAVMLKDEFPAIKHIVNTGLPEGSSDAAIWDYARKNDYHIITNDEDFYLLVINKGFPPKVILLRTGNQSTKYIALILTKHKTEIIDFIDNSEYGVLEIF